MNQRWGINRNNVLGQRRSLGVTCLISWPKLKARRDQYSLSFFHNEDVVINQIIDLRPRVKTNKGVTWLTNTQDGNGMSIWFTVCVSWTLIISLCVSFFPFWFWGWDVACYCINSWSLPFYLLWQIPAPLSIHPIHALTIPMVLSHLLSPQRPSSDSNPLFEPPGMYFSKLTWGLSVSVK